MLERYPQCSDIVTTVKDIVSLGQSLDYYKSLGIIFVARARNQIADMSSQFFLGYNDYTVLQELALADKTQTAVSTFYVDSACSLIPNVIDYSSGKKQVDKPEITDVIDNGDGSYLCAVKYTTHKPGKLDLLTHIDREFKLQIETLDNKYKITIYHEHPEDATQTEKLINAVLKNDENYIKTGRVAKLDVSILTSEQRTLLFDNLMKHEFDDLRTVEVTKIHQRKDGESDKTLLDKDVESISSAIIQGSDLRSNTYIKKLEEGGFYISGMTVKFENKKEPITYEINIALLQKEQYPRIRIQKCEIKTYDSDGKEIYEDYSLTYEDKEKYCYLIHSALEEVYLNILQSIKK